MLSLGLLGIINLARTLNLRDPGKIGIADCIVPSSNKDITHLLAH